MNDTRKILSEAFAADDETQADFARWEHRRQQQQQQLVCKDYSSGGRFTDDARYGIGEDEKSPQSQPSQYMDDESSARWNAWAEEIAFREAEAIGMAVVKVLGEETAKTRREQDAELRAWTEGRIASLEKRLAALETKKRGR